MTIEFRKRIRKAIASPTLQIALDANAERRVKGRISALETLPNWRERRQQAHSIRADVIEHLDTYLDQFVASAQSNGIVIHRAKSAAEAIKTVLEIVGGRWTPAFRKISGKIQINGLRRDRT